MSFIARVASAALVVCLVPGVALAQDGRIRVSAGAAAAAASGGDADLALGGTVGYRFSDRFWFEAEFTHIDEPVEMFFPYAQLAERDRPTTLPSSAQLFVTPGWSSTSLPLIYPPITIPSGVDGSTMIGTVGLRYEMPVQGGRLRPYLTGGLGLARTRQEFSLDPRWLALGLTVEPVTDTGYAASAGVGASLRVVKQVSLDVDARYFRLSRNRNLVRLGGGVSVRF